MGAYTTYKSVAPNAASTYELLDTRPSVAEMPGAAELDAVQGNLVSRTSLFAIRPRTRCWTASLFSASPKATVALVGGIGSGKSTVFNPLLRF